MCGHFLLNSKVKLISNIHVIYKQHHKMAAIQIRIFWNKQKGIETASIRNINKNHHASLC